MPEQLSDCPTDDKLLPYSYFYHNACIYARDFDALRLLEMAVNEIEKARKMLYTLRLKIEFPPSLSSFIREADVMLEEATAYARVAIKKMKEDPTPQEGAIEK
jgi:hypothetical protein